MHAGAARFDPASTAQVFRVSSPDFMAASFLAGAVRRFCGEAPRARLVVQPLGAEFDYERGLAEGELDVVISNWPDPPPHLHLSLLIEDEVVCLTRRDDPRAVRGLTREQYLVARHLVPLPYSRSQRGVVETHLAMPARVTRCTRGSAVLRVGAVSAGRHRPGLHHGASFRSALRTAVAAGRLGRAVRLSAHALLPAVARALALVGSTPLAARLAVGGSSGFAAGGAGGRRGWDGRTSFIG